MSTGGTPRRSERRWEALERLAMERLRTSRAEPTMPGQLPAVMPRDANLYMGRIRMAARRRTPPIELPTTQFVQALLVAEYYREGRGSDTPEAAAAALVVWAAINDEYEREQRQVAEAAVASVNRMQEAEQRINAAIGYVVIYGNYGQDHTVDAATLQRTLSAIALALNRVPDEDESPEFNRAVYYCYTHALETYGNHAEAIRTVEMMIDGIRTTANRYLETYRTHHGGADCPLTELNDWIRGRVIIDAESRSAPVDIPEGVTISRIVRDGEEDVAEIRQAFDEQPLRDAIQRRWRELTSQLVPQRDIMRALLIRARSDYQAMCVGTVSGPQFTAALDELIGAIRDAPTPPQIVNTAAQYFENVLEGLRANGMIWETTAQIIYENYPTSTIAAELQRIAQAAEAFAIYSRFRRRPCTTSRADTELVREIVGDQMLVLTPQLRDVLVGTADYCGVPIAGRVLREIREAVVVLHDEGYAPEEYDFAQTRRMDPLPELTEPIEIGIQMGTELQRVSAELRNISPRRDRATPPDYENRRPTRTRPSRNDGLFDFDVLDEDGAPVDDPRTTKTFQSAAQLLQRYHDLLEASPLAWFEFEVRGPVRRFTLLTLRAKHQRGQRSEFVRTVDGIYETTPGEATTIFTEVNEATNDGSQRNQALRAIDLS